MMGDYQVRFCERLRGETPLCLLGGFSEIKALFLRKIHAVTFQGFFIKLIMFILAFTINKITL